MRTDTQSEHLPHHLSKVSMNVSALNGVPIMNDELVQLVEQVKPVSEALEIETDLGGATEFEIITTMMFLYFGEINPVDFVVIEAGLGIKMIRRMFLNLCYPYSQV